MVGCWGRSVVVGCWGEECCSGVLREECCSGVFGCGSSGQGLAITA